MVQYNDKDKDTNKGKDKDNSSIRACKCDRYVPVTMQAKAIFQTTGNLAAWKTSETWENTRHAKLPNEGKHWKQKTQMEAKWWIGETTGQTKRFRANRQNPKCVNTTSGHLTKKRGTVWTKYKEMNWPWRQNKDENTMGAYLDHLCFVEALIQTKQL